MLSSKIYSTMRYYSVFFLSVVLFACHKKEEPALPISLEKFDAKPIMLPPSGTYSFTANQDVSWKMNSNAGGALSFTQGIATAATTSKYQAPATPGIYSFTIKGVRNPQDSLVVKIGVSSQFAILDSLIRRGNYVLSFRHAAADVGSDTFGAKETSWWKSCDSKLARQLNTTGEDDARKIGKTIKALQIPVTRVIASEYCRCMKTAELMNLGLLLLTNQDITFYVYDEVNRYTKTVQLISTQPNDGKVTVLVTHAGFGGTLPSNPVLNTLNWGDAAVFKSVLGKDAQYVSTIPVSDWTILAN